MGRSSPLIERLEARCRELAIEPPTADRVERIARAALRAHEEQFHADIYARLSPVNRERLEELLGSAEGEGDPSVAEEVPGSAPAALLALRGNPGRPSLASMQEELAKLELIRRIGPSSRSVRSRFATRAGALPAARRGRGTA